MTWGSGVGTGATVVIATAPNLPVFFAGWIIAGMAMSAVFYQPAFAAPQQCVSS